MGAENEDKLLKLMNENDSASEFTEAMLGELGEQILPKILPKLKPLFKKLSDFLGDDENVIMLKKQKGEDGMYLLIIKSDGMNMTMDQECFKVYQIEQFLELLINNDLETLAKKFE